MSISAVTFLSDFGLRDHYVAAVKAVILDISAGATIVDISHEVAPHSIQEAAFTLAAVYSLFPSGTVHLAVVDPGVGSERLPIIAVSEKHTFVAPDNGLLSLVYAREAIQEVVVIDRERFFRAPVSPTFHGRDIFGPVAAHLARGVPPDEFGYRRHDFVHLEEARNRVSSAEIRGSVLHIDRFGNVITSVHESELLQLGSDRRALQIRIGEETIRRHCDFYAQGDSESRLFSIVGSSGYLEIAARSESAARIMGARTGEPVRVQLR